MPSTPATTPPAPIEIQTVWCPSIPCASSSAKASSAKLHEFVHSTGGAHAAVENATQIGRQIADQLKAAGVTGVILTST